MKTNTTVVTRGDRLEARELRDMFESRPFNEYAKRIDLMIETARKQCEQAEGLKELRHAQGALKALRAVRRLPEILTGELQGKNT